MTEKCICLKLSPADGKESLVGGSRLFGAPDVPEAWLENEFCDGEIFLCQINCADARAKTGDARLPERGMLYFFLDTSGEEYVPYVRYFDGVGELCRVAFNEEVDSPYDILTEYAIDFEAREESEEDDLPGLKLFGFPAKLTDGCMGANFTLLFQYDTQAHPALDFLRHRDRFLYVLIHRDALAVRAFDETYIYREND